MSVGNNISNAYGVNSPYVSVFPLPLNEARDPGAFDFAEVGQLWINFNTNVVWMAVNQVNGQAVWNRVENAGGPGVFTDLTATGTINLDSLASTVNLQSATSTMNISSGTTTTVAAGSSLTETAATTVAITGGTGFSATATTGNASITSTAAAASLVGGTTATVTAGSGVATVQSLTNATATSVNITSPHGGITLASNTTNGTSGITLDGHTGPIRITSEDDSGNAILLQTNAGTAESITISSLQGTDPASINIASLNGGVTVIGNAGGVTIEGNAGGVSISSTENGVGSINIDANGGTSETVVIQSKLGTGQQSINISSVHGGISIASNTTNGNLGILMQGNTGQVLIASNINFAPAIQLATNGGTASTIEILNILGTFSDCIRLRSLNGGISVVSSALAANTGLFLEQNAVTAAIQTGNGVPAHTAPQGSLYINTSGVMGQRLYSNTNGTNTWTALSVA